MEMLPSIRVNKTDRPYGLIYCGQCYEMTIKLKLRNYRFDWQFIPPTGHQRIIPPLIVPVVIPPPKSSNKATTANTTMRTVLVVEFMIWVSFKRANLNW